MIFFTVSFSRFTPSREKPKRGYVRMLPQNENWNEGTFAKTTLYETALLSPGDKNPPPPKRKIFMFGLFPVFWRETSPQTWRIYGVRGPF